jgi:hypothetical protein
MNRPTDCDLPQGANVGCGEGLRPYPTKGLAIHEKSLTGVARSARTALVVPSLFALGLVVIKQPELAGFAVFGTFAHLVSVNYDPEGTARFAQSAMLTLLGAFMIGLGTLVSGTAWLAVAGAGAAGFVSELPAVAGGRIAVIRRALLLSFMLAVATPAPSGSVFPYLAGWLTAGVIAQPALLVIWFPLQNCSAAHDGAGSPETGSNAPIGGLAWIGNAIGSGLAMGFAVLITHLFKVEHAFWVVLGVLPVLSATSLSPARTFCQEQAGTLMGFALSAFMVAVIGTDQAWYWFILPLVVFVAAYAASTLGFTVGQAAFTLFAVVLYCILLPQDRHAGILRTEDIAIGGAVSLVVSSLLRLGERLRVLLPVPYAPGGRTRPADETA